MRARGYIYEIKELILSLSKRRLSSCSKGMFSVIIEQSSDVAMCGLLSHSHPPGRSLESAIAVAGKPSARPYGFKKFFGKCWK